MQRSGTPLLFEAPAFVGKELDKKISQRPGRKILAPFASHEHPEFARFRRVLERAGHEHVVLTSNKVCGSRAMPAPARAAAACASWLLPLKAMRARE